MNQKSNKLTVPDLISVGVFTALYFVLVTVATFACVLLPGVGNILLPAVAALISGSVYMLLARQAAKIRRHHDHGPCDGPVLLRLRPFCAVVRGQHHLRRRGRPGGRCWQIPRQKAAAGQLRRVFLWPDRPDFAAVVHEIRLHSQPDGPRARTPPTSTRCLHPSTAAALWSAYWQF